LSEREHSPPGALAGIRVVDLTRILAGPFCTQLLADMGADVIKIETGRGDPVRGQGTMVAGESAYFAQFNRNKRSVVLDLYTSTDKDTLTALLKSADVVVENYRPGVFAEMGYTPEFLEQLNPQLIHGSVNGYGTSGPYVDRPSFDFIAQAMSGFMAVNGDPGGPARRAAPPMSDLIAGLYCAFGIVSAERTASACAGNTATMTQSAASTTAWLSAAIVMRSAPNSSTSAAPLAAFRGDSTKDGSQVPG